MACASPMTTFLFELSAVSGFEITKSGKGQRMIRPGIQVVRLGPDPLIAGRNSSLDGNASLTETRKHGLRCPGGQKQPRRDFSPVGCAIAV